MTVFFKDDDFQFGVEEALGGSYRQAADVGEVLATVGRIRDGDADSWVREWTATGAAAWAAGEQADTSGRPTSALAHYRRAGDVLRRRAVAPTARHRARTGAGLDLWRRQRECWDRTVDRMPVPGERVAIPYEGTALPAYFFRAPDSDPEERRPLIILNNGSDGATSQTWVHGGAAASERGYHWMTFDGPGQQADVLRPGDPLPTRLGGRAHARARRGSATPRRRRRPDRCHRRQPGRLLDPPSAGVRAPPHGRRRSTPESSTSPRLGSASLPEVMRCQLEHRQQTSFDREMRLAEMFSPATAATLAFSRQALRPQRRVSLRSL